MDRPFIRYVGVVLVRHATWVLFVIGLGLVGTLLREGVPGLRNALIDQAWAGFAAVPVVALITAPVNLAIAGVLWLVRKRYVTVLQRSLVATLTWVVVAAFAIVPQPTSSASEKAVSFAAVALAGLTFGLLLPNASPDGPARG